MATKIELSIFFIFGFFFFRIVGSIMIRKLKNFHINNNTGLVDKYPFIFKFFSLFFKAASIFCLIYVVMIWVGLITLPSE